MDVSGSSHELVVATPPVLPSVAVKRTSRLSGIIRRVARASPAAASRSSGNRVRSIRSRNDQKLINWMRQTIIKLEAEVKTKQAKIDELNARPAPFTEREMYLLSEIELIDRQFESEYSPVWLLLTVHLWLVLHTYLFLYSQRSTPTGKQRIVEWKNVLLLKRKVTLRVRSTSGQIFLRPRFWPACWIEYGALPCCWIAVTPPCPVCIGCCFLTTRSRGV